MPRQNSRRRSSSRCKRVLPRHPCHVRSPTPLPGHSLELRERVDEPPFVVRWRVVLPDGMCKPYPFLVGLAGTGRFELETYCFFVISFCGRVEPRQDLTFFPSQLYFGIKSS